MKHIILTMTAALALGGCAATDSGGGGGNSTPCMITATGNKLCGADAAGWCRATDSIRQGTTDPALERTQRDCDSLEIQYPGSG